MPGEPVSTLVVFCDYVIVDSNTGKNSLIGTFSVLASQRFPLQIPQFYVHTTIANYVPTGERVTVVVNLKQVASGAVIGSAAIPLGMQAAKGGQPPRQININVPFQKVMFSAPGTYECEILFAGEKVGARFLEVALNQPQQPPQPPSPPNL